MRYRRMTWLVCLRV